MQFFHNMVINTQISFLIFYIPIDGVLYNWAVDYSLHHKHAICIGIVPEALPLLYGFGSQLKILPTQMIMALFSTIVSLVLSLIIMKEKTRTEQRFRARMGNRLSSDPATTYTHPALEHLKPVSQTLLSIDYLLLAIKLMLLSVHCFLPGRVLHVCY